MKKYQIYGILYSILIIGGLLIFLFFSCNSFKPSGKEYAIEIRDGVKFFNQGYLEYREGIPFIYLKGDSYNIGLQYGVLLKEEMRSFYAQADSSMNVMMDRVYSESPWYMDIVIWAATPFVISSKLSSFKKRIPEDYLTQLKGMSEGSGIPLNDLLMATCADWLPCSSFIKNVNGSIIHGRNADHIEALDFTCKYPLIARYCKDGKYSYIDIGIIGTPFTVTGINEYGLTLSWSQATSKPFDGKGSMLMFNSILEECRNLKDVDKISKNVDRFVTMIGSLEDGTGAAYDIVDEKSVRTDSKNGYIYATNRCVSQSMRKEYNSIFDMDWFNSSRAYTYENILSNDGEFSVDDAINLLSNTDFYSYTGKIPPFKGGNINNNQTGSSVVLDPANCTVYFAYGTTYGSFYRWLKYNYKTEEVSIYKNEDDRLHDPDVIEYMKLEKRWNNIDWENKDELQQMVYEIEQLSVENFWTLHNSCWAWYNLGKYEKVKEIINRQIEKYPDFLSSYSNMGFFYMYQKNYEEAINYFKKSLDTRITNESKQMYCYEQLAAIYTEIGDVTKSKDCYSRVLDYYNRYWIPEQSREEVNRIEELLETKN